MERNATYSYAGMINTHGASGAAGLFPAPHVDPPVSKQVLERLASSLTLPAGSTHRKPLNMVYEPTQRDASLVEKPSAGMLRAYEQCSRIASTHSKSFYFSARLLPQAKRAGIMALYAFCRTSDDIVDNADAHADAELARTRARIALDHWDRLNSSPDPASNHPVITAWADTRQRFGIPTHLADDLLAGIRMDLTISSYATWDDLWLYCYRVASTVGLMSMYVTGTESMEAVPYAVQLGVALQLTNILRDIGEDARSGRIYLPEEDMEAFGYSAEKLREGIIDRSFTQLMKYEIARARALYDTAIRGIALLPADSRLAVTAA
ncbi:MAG TPA: phytoene/squalene synthase family protein, partial [Chloroflexia bacterium]|nr:phytoene/squalene synthase family protein [Chloroflexia bacterium]